MLRIAPLFTLESNYWHCYHGAHKNRIAPCRSSQSNTNKYESGEKINAAAQRTLIIDSGSETDSNAYESYTTVGEEEEEAGKGQDDYMQRRLTEQMRRGKRLECEGWGGGDEGDKSGRRGSGEFRHNK